MNEKTPALRLKGPNGFSFRPQILDHNRRRPLLRLLLCLRGRVDPVPGGSGWVGEVELEESKRRGVEHQSWLLIDIIGSLVLCGRGTCSPSVRQNLLHCDISRVLRVRLVARD